MGSEMCIRDSDHLVIFERLGDFTSGGTDGQFFWVVKYRVDGFARFNSFLYQSVVVLRVCFSSSPAATLPRCVHCVSRLPCGHSKHEMWMTP